MNKSHIYHYFNLYCTLTEAIEHHYRVQLKFCLNNPNNSDSTYLLLYKVSNIHIKKDILIFVFCFVQTTYIRCISDYPIQTRDHSSITSAYVLPFLDPPTLSADISISSYPPTYISFCSLLNKAKIRRGLFLLE